MTILIAPASRSVAGAVDEGEQAGQGLVRVDAAVGGLAAEQPLLEFEWAVGCR